MALFPSAFAEYYGFTAFTTEHTKLTENAQIRLLSLNYYATIINRRVRRDVPFSLLSALETERHICF